MRFIECVNAYQTEYEVLVSTLGRYYSQRFERYPVSITQQTYRPIIAEVVLKLYNITDPKVVRLKDHSLNNILLGKPF